MQALQHELLDFDFANIRLDTIAAALDAMNQSNN
jgi:hypothetical protein